MKTTVSPRSSANSTATPIPKGFHTVTPHLVCDGAADALEFYKNAFGAVELMRVPTPNGKLLHASVQIGDSIVMLNDEFPEMGSLGPKTRNGSSVAIHLFVDDVDASFERALNAGATMKMPLQDMFWGDRYGQLEDPFGHSWSIATHQRDLSQEQIQKAARDACR